MNEFYQPPQTRTLDDAVTPLNGYESSFEFSKFFESKKIKNFDNSDAYLWRVSNHTLKMVDTIFFDLPGLKSSIAKISKIVIGKGIINKNIDKETEIEKKQKELFLKSFPGGHLRFLWETYRLIETKGNCLISLVDFSDKKDTEKENIEDFNWINIGPENFGISVQTDKPLAKYLQGDFIYFSSKKALNVQNHQKLNSENTIHLKSELSSVLGVPPIIINGTFSNAILSDINSFNQTKKRGGTKKQLMTLYTETESGIRKYVDENDRKQFQNDMNKAIASSKTHTAVSNVEAKIQEIVPAESNEDFQDLMESVYPMFIANLVGIAPYSLLPPKSINRATAEEQYKEMIQQTVQPMNNLLSEKVQEMYQIWCKATGEEATMELTLDNPKPQLTLQKNLLDLIKAANSGIITIDEVRSEMGLNPASEETKKAFERKVSQSILKETAISTEKFTI